MLAQNESFYGFDHAVIKNIKFIIYCIKIIKIDKNMGVPQPMSATKKTILSNVDQLQ